MRITTRFYGCQQWPTNDTQGPDRNTHKILSFSCSQGHKYQGPDIGAPISIYQLGSLFSVGCVPQAHDSATQTNVQCSGMPVKQGTAKIAWKMILSNICQPYALDLWASHCHWCIAIQFPNQLCQPAPSAAQRFAHFYYQWPKYLSSRCWLTGTICTPITTERQSKTTNTIALFYLSTNAELHMKFALALFVMVCTAFVLVSKPTPFSLHRMQDANLELSAPNVLPAAIYTWAIGDWEPCSRDCGCGVSNRPVKCISSAG